ncbi:hypothetical protein Tco_0791010 [Tanacetum coccineum]
MKLHTSGGGVYCIILFLLAGYLASGPNGLYAESDMVGGGRNHFDPLYLYGVFMKAMFIQDLCRMLPRSIVYPMHKWWEKGTLPSRREASGYSGLAPLLSYVDHQYSQSALNSFGLMSRNSEWVGVSLLLTLFKDVLDVAGSFLTTIKHTPPSFRDRGRGEGDLFLLSLLKTLVCGDGLREYLSPRLLLGSVRAVGVLDSE